MTLEADKWKVQPTGFVNIVLVSIKLPKEFYARNT